MTPQADHENASSGTVHGAVLQSRDIHGGVHFHGPAESGPLTDVSLDAPRPATRIRDREGLLSTLEAAMAQGDAQPHVLVGPGGIGKSTVAAELARRAAAAGRAVYWVRPGSVAPSLLEIAVELGGERAEADRLASAPRRAARWAWRHLDAAAEPWLLVFDNADRPEELDPENRPGEGVGWLRPSPGGLVLVTTRVGAPEVWAPAVMHPVEALEAEDAAAVLRDNAGIAEGAGDRALAERLAGFPLALALAGRVMAAHRTMFRDFRQLQHHLADSVARIDELARPLPVGGASLSGTWDVSVAMLADTPQAAPLLNLLCMLGAEGVEVPLRRLPVNLLRDGSADTGPQRLDEAVVARALNALAQQGLLAVTQVGGERALRVHPLISETTRANLGERAAAVAAEAAALLRAREDRDRGLEHAAWRAVAAVRADALGGEHPDTLDAEVARDRAYLRRGVDIAAARLQLAELAARTEEILGPEHRVTLRAHHHHGDALMLSGRPEQAELVFRRVYEQRERAFGAEDMETLNARHQVAVAALRQGELETAAAEFRAVLEAMERQKGADDLTALNARLNLAYVAMKRGHWDAAEQEYRDILARRSRLLGPEHALTTAAKYYLALTALERGDATSAREQFAEVVRLWTESQGEHHPDTQLACKRLAQAEQAED